MRIRSIHRGCIAGFVCVSLSVPMSMAAAGGAEIDGIRDSRIGIRAADTPRGRDARAPHENESRIPLLSSSSTPTSVGREGLEPVSEGAILSEGAAELVRTGGALAIVLGVLFIVFAIARRFVTPLGAIGRPSGVLEILARYPLGKGHRLMLLKMDRRVLLLHQSGSSMRTLSEVVDPDEVAALLGRIEAGGRTRHREFEAMLARAGESFGELNGSRDRIETIDLTRRTRPGWARSWSLAARQVRP